MKRVNLVCLYGGLVMNKEIDLYGCMSQLHMLHEIYGIEIFLTAMNYVAQQLSYDYAIQTLYDLQNPDKSMDR
jgi:hypothetical protein